MRRVHGIHTLTAASINWKQYIIERPALWLVTTIGRPPGTSIVLGLGWRIFKQRRLEVGTQSKVDVQSCQRPIRTKNVGLLQSDNKANHSPEMPCAATVPHGHISAIILPANYPRMERPPIRTRWQLQSRLIQHRTCSISLRLSTRPFHLAWRSIATLPS